MNKSLLQIKVYFSDQPPVLQTKFRKVVRKDRLNVGCLNTEILFEKIVFSVSRDFSSKLPLARYLTASFYKKIRSDSNRGTQKNFGR